MKIVLSLLMLIFLPISVCAQNPQIDRIDVPDYGIYTTITQQDTASGSSIGHHVVSDERLAAMTRTVPMQIGVHFGFHYTVVGTPAGIRVPLRIVTYFPPPGLRNPQASQPILRHEYVFNALIGFTTYHDYSLDDPWELVPGTWTMEIWSGDHKLLSESFTVANP